MLAISDRGDQPQAGIGGRGPGQPHKVLKNMVGAAGIEPATAGSDIQAPEINGFSDFPTFQ
jgi:hypothetical protein